MIIDVVPGRGGDELRVCRLFVEEVKPGLLEYMQWEG